MQELDLYMVQPNADFSKQPSYFGPRLKVEREYQKWLESQAAWRCQVGLNLRKAVSQLPRLTSLTLSHVSLEEPGPDVVALHPYSQLR